MDELRRTCVVLLALLIVSAGCAVAQLETIDALKKRVEQTSEAGKYDEALAVQRELAIEVERAEKERSGRAGQLTAEALNQTAWYLLLARKFEQALEHAERAYALAPHLLWIEVNRAHALLILDRVEEARALYRLHKGKPLSPSSSDVWETVVADDFETLRRVGLDRPAYLEVLADLGVDPQEHQRINALLDQARQFYEQGKYVDAATSAEQCVVAAKTLHGENHARFALAISWLAHIYDAQGRYDEAEALKKQSLAIKEAVFGPNHSEVASELDGIAALHSTRALYSEAEPLYRRALQIRETVLGPEHADVGTSLNNIALLLQRLGRYREADPLYGRSLEIKEKALGSDHPRVATSLNNLALLRHQQGRHAEAEQILQRALNIEEKALGPDHPSVASTLNTVSIIYAEQGRQVEAERSLKRALAINEKALGTGHPLVATALDNIAVLYDELENYRQAEPLMRRALAIRERAFGPDHPSVAISLNNLAELFRKQRRYVEAEPLFKRSLAIHESIGGSDHSDVALALDNLGKLYTSWGRYAQAVPLYERALSTREKVLGHEHGEVAKSLNNLAYAEDALGHSVDAKRHYEQALAIHRKVWGEDHPSVATTLNNLALFYFAQSQWSSASEYARQSADILIRRTRRNALAHGSLTSKGMTEAERDSDRFGGLIKSVYRVSGPNAATDMFTIAQWAQSSEAATSLAQMAVRQAKVDGALASAIRKRQDLVSEWQATDKLLTDAVSGSPDLRNAAAQQELRIRLASVNEQIEQIDKKLAQDFPEYAALANPEPLLVSEVQTLLRDDEALVQLFDTPKARSTQEETFIWLITKTDLRWFRSELGTDSLTDRVAILRCGLDHTLWNPQLESVSAQTCKAKVGTVPFVAEVSGRREMVLPFDLSRAHELYKSLLGPVEDLTRNKHLIIVSNGPLSTLPLHVLVTQPPKIAIPANLGEYRKTSWLGIRQPVTILPSVASLKVLRQFARTSRASKPYLGIGNPLLDGQQNHPQWGGYYKKQAELARQKQSCTKTSSEGTRRPGKRQLTSFSKLFRGAHADVEQVRSCAPLPDTADELCDVRRRLGVPESDVLLGSRAKESVLKELSDHGRLADYRIVHFATHGALSGQVQGSAEPGLILTPPNNGTAEKHLERDDGFLTASEISTLKLDADWVILSACNTAAAAGDSTQTLSGMARAFFYAGARALLVSHWEVGSQAAVKLTTRAFEELGANRMTGRAEAFRVAMRQLQQDGSLAEAHPSQWAPFVVVGEGGKKAYVGR